jgi:general secretion pathway protein B
MSYILEALRKADQERAIGAVPRLESEHQVMPATRRSFWFWPLVTVLALNGLFFTFIIARDAGLFSSGHLDAASLAPRATEVPEESTRDPEYGWPAEDVAPSVEAPTLETTGTGVWMPAPAKIEPAGGEMGLVPDTAGLFPAHEPDFDELQPDPASLSVPTPARAGDVEMPGPEYGEIPFWEEMPIEMRSRLSPMRIDVHVYSEEPGRRFVLMNLHKYRQGDSLENGVNVEEIVPDGIVISYMNELYKIRK